MMKILLSLIPLLISVPCLSSEKVVGLVYYKNFMGHVHEKPNTKSPSLTTIQCSQPLKVINSTTVAVPAQWTYVKAGDDRGFVYSLHTTKVRPKCFQSRYPRFYQHLDLDIAQMYYWGRLYDLYISSESQIE